MGSATRCLTGLMLLSAALGGCGEGEPASGRNPDPLPVPTAFGGDGEVTESRLVLGDTWTCVLREDRQVRCFGALPFMVLPEDRDDPLVPVPVSTLAPLAGAVEIEGQVRSLCARDGAGRVVCVEEGGLSALEPLEGAIDIAVAGPLVCGVYEDGSVRCLRHGRLEPSVTDGIDDAVSLEESGGYVCARRREHPVECWDGDEHSIRQRTLPGPSNPPGIADVEGRPTAILDDGTLHRVAARSPDRPITVFDGHGGRYCAIDRGGVLLCLDPVGRRYLPTPLEGPAREVVVGLRHACVRLEDGRVSCWGTDEVGQTSGEPPPALNVLSAVDGVTGAVDLALSEALGCALQPDGLVCWTRADARPVAVPIEPPLVDVVSCRAEVCGRTASGAVSCIDPSREVRAVEGLDASGGLLGEQVLGGVLAAVDGERAVTLADMRSPRGVSLHRLPALDGARDLGFVAHARLCGIDDNGTLVCDGDVEVPTDEHPPSGMERLFATGRARFGTRGRAVFAWGEDTNGRLGVPLRSAFGAAPDENPDGPWPVLGLSSPEGMVSSSAATCAWFASDPPLCTGELALDRPRVSAREPYGPMPGVEAASLVDLVPGGGCVLSSGSVRCWGAVRGDGHPRERPELIDVPLED
ncbi:MAG: hypothetical protein AB8I08_10540 [Sandaracinaceae bacterium]